MSIYDCLPSLEKERIDTITLYGNSERNAFDEDLKKWFLSKEEHTTAIEKLHDLVKNEIVKILQRNDNCKYEKK